MEPLVADNLVFWIIVGAVAGWLASLVARTSERMGCLLNIVVGVVGAVIGGWILDKLGLRAPGGRILSAIVTSFLGATVFLLVLKLVSPPPR
ncbi:MAG: GlsB/YeaQ/YmgE family stress response membrane protein [Actinomycetota bacterium]